MQSSHFGGASAALGLASIGSQHFGAMAQHKGYQDAIIAQGEETIRNIEHLQWQESLSEEATRATDLEHEENKLRFLDKQSVAMYGAGIGGGATAEALQDEATVKLNAAQRLARMKGNMQAAMIRQRQGSAVRSSGYKMRSIAGQSKGTMLTSAGNMLGQVGSMFETQARIS